MQRSRGKRHSMAAPWVILAAMIVLAACGSASKVAIHQPVVSDLRAGKLLSTRSPKIETAQAVGINWGNSPNLNLRGARLITRFGATYVAEFNGTISQLFVRSTPGSTWKHLGELPGNALQLDFPTPVDGFALVQSEAPGSAVSLYSTTDGAKTWKLRDSATFIQIHFFTANHGIALLNHLAANSSGPATLSVSSTSDGGKTWNTSGSLPSGNISNPPATWVSFSFISPERGYLAIGGEPGAGSQFKSLYKTDSGGVSWSEVATSPSSSSTLSLPMGGYLEQVNFTSDTSGYLVLARGPRGALYVTSDGGVHWSVQQVLPADASPSTSLAYFEPNTPFGAIALTNIGSLWNKPRSVSTWHDIYPPYWAEKLSIYQSKLAIVTSGGRTLEMSLSSGSGLRATKTPSSNLVDFQLFKGVKLAVSKGSIWKQLGSQGWYRSPLPSGYQALFADFATPSAGIIAAIPDRNSILYTSDDGTRWYRVPVPFMPLSPDALSASDWWMIGGNVGPLVPNPYKKDVRVMTYYLYHTSNAGKTWTRYSSSSWAQVGPYGVKFLNSSTGYLWTPYQLLLTTDGGKSFVARSLPSWLSISSSHGLAPADGGQAWVADGSYPLLKTTNFGANFDIVPAKG